MTSVANVVARYKLANAEKWPDGRLRAKLGDKVYQMAPGPFGTASTVNGVVFLSRGKLRVRVTGSSSLMGNLPVRGRTYPADENWTVVGDPAIKARQERREFEEAEQEAKVETTKRDAHETIEHEARRLGLKRIRSISEIEVGDQVYSILSEGTYGLGDPSKISVNDYIVKEIAPRWFLYLDENGREVTSGLVTSWWVKG